MADQVTVAAPEMENQEVVTILKSELVRLKAAEKELKALQLHVEKLESKGSVTVEEVDEIDDTDATDGEEVDDVDAEKEVDEDAKTQAV